ncbi:MAG: hypothetical protein RRY79_03155 [Clostridia bacterium]
MDFIIIIFVVIVVVSSIVSATLKKKEEERRQNAEAERRRMGHPPSKGDVSETPSRLPTEQATRTTPMEEEEIWGAPVQKQPSRYQPQPQPQPQQHSRSQQPPQQRHAPPPKAFTAQNLQQPPVTKMNSNANKRTAVTSLSTNHTNMETSMKGSSGPPPGGPEKAVVRWSDWQNSSSDLALFSSPNDIIRGVVFAEILGKPRSMK